MFVTKLKCPNLIILAKVPLRNTICPEKVVMTDMVAPLAPVALNLWFYLVTLTNLNKKNSLWLINHEF